MTLWKRTKSGADRGGAYHGLVGVDSEVGRGASFTIILPIREPEEAHGKEVGAV
jgi:hypothetical protein